MKGKTRFERALRWGLLVGAAGVAPAFIMRCDKAALNFQRGLYEGLGDSLSEALVEGGFLVLDDTADQQ